MRRRRNRGCLSGCLSYILLIIVIIIAIPYVNRYVHNAKRRRSNVENTLSNTPKEKQTERKTEKETECQTVKREEQIIKVQTEETDVPIETLTEVTLGSISNDQVEASSEALTEIQKEINVEEQLKNQSELQTEVWTENTTEKEAELSTEKKLIIYRSTARLNVRSLPSTDGEILGKINENEVVPVLEIENRWAKIDFNGTNAYVSANYLSLEDSTPKSEEIVENTIKETERIPSDDTVPVEYSSNDRETAKNGNSGIYSYKNKGSSYDSYYIIDFDEGYVYFFTDGNENDTCERLKIDSGDLNSVLIVTYHDGGDVWQNGLHFRWKNQPDHLILQDNYGTETDFYTTNLDEALEIKNKKSIVDY